MERTQDGAQASVIKRVTRQEWKRSTPRPQSAFATKALPPQALAWMRKGTAHALPLVRAARKHSAHVQADSKRRALSSSTRYEQRIAKLESTVRDLQEQLTKVLAPPVVRTVEEKTPHSLTLNNAWLREHKQEHRGKWVALRDGVLLGADKSRVALHRQLEQRGELAGSAFARL